MEAKQHLGALPTDRTTRTAEVLLWLAIIAASVTAVALFSALLAFCSPSRRPADLPEFPQAGTVGAQNTGFDPGHTPREGFWNGFPKDATAPANVSAGVTPRKAYRCGDGGHRLSFARFPSVEHAGDRDRCFLFEAVKEPRHLGQTIAGSESVGGAQGEV